MDINTYQALSNRVEDVIVTDGYPVATVVMGAMGDGSGRHFALVTTHDNLNEQEQVYRVATPAPSTAPAWARERYQDHSVEVRVGDGWMLLEPDEEV